MKHTVMWLDENNKSRLDYRQVVMNTLSNDVALIRRRRVSTEPVTKHRKGRRTDG